MSLLGARALLAIPTLLGVTLVTFALVHLAPGDPARLRAGLVPGVTDEMVAEYRALAGLDRPLPERYVAWLSRSVRLDFGVSHTDGTPVRDRMAQALPITLALGLLAALLAVTLALPLGALAALLAGRPAARAIDAALALVYGVPVLAVGLLALRAGAPYGAGTSLFTLLVPAACLAVPSMVALARQQRSATTEVLASDYVRTARGKGAGPARVLLRHALRPSLLPLVAVLGGQVPVLLSGSVLVERMFGLRGLGELGCAALLARDYPTLMALATVAAVLTVAGTLCADAAAMALDPRRGRGS